MSSVSLNASSVDAPRVLSGQLVDAVVEAVLRLPDAHARSAAMSSLVGEVCAAVFRRYQDNPSRPATAEVELASARQVAAAAQSHAWRMSLLRTDTMAGHPR